jgi:hypothetical protein
VVESDDVGVAEARVQLGPQPLRIFPAGEGTDLEGEVARVEVHRAIGRGAHRHDFHRCGARPDHSELLGGRVRQVDDALALAHEGAAVVDADLDGAVVFNCRTRTRVPMGRVRWAAVMACMSYISPLEARLPWKSGPYQEASPCWRNPFASGIGWYHLPRAW